MLVATLAVAAAWLLVAPPAPAAVACNPSINYVPGAPPRCEARRYARETIFLLTAPEFMNRKQDFTINGCNSQAPQPGGCRKPFPYNQFDWGTDGCSFTPEPWRTIFDGPCEQHDFGYRNFSKGLRLGPTEARRLMIDNRFRNEMFRVCEPWSYPDKVTCYVAARTAYNAVRNLGGGLWGWH
jgi:hypothetical protein